MKAERKGAVTRKRPYRQTCGLDVESGLSADRATVGGVPAMTWQQLLESRNAKREEASQPQIAAHSPPM
jgi:hypothetical protein